MNFEELCFTKSNHLLDSLFEIFIRLLKLGQPKLYFDFSSKLYFGKFHFKKLPYSENVQKGTYMEWLPLLFI